MTYVSGAADSPLMRPPTWVVIRRLGMAMMNCRVLAATTADRETSPSGGDFWISTLSPACDP